jgi:AraC-like DNA-binding protein
MSVSILLVRTVVEAVERAGVDRSSYLRAARLSTEELEDSDRRIEIDRYDELQLLALEMTGDEAFGLNMGEQASLATFDVLGPLWLHVSTMREGIRVFERFHRIMSDCRDPQLVEEGPRATFHYEFPRSHPRCNQIRSEFGLTVLLRMGQAYVGRDKFPLRACFEHAEPSYRARYREIFGGSERFKQPFTGLEFASTWLDHVQLHQNPELSRVLETQAVKKLQRLSPQTPTCDRVRSQLEKHGPAERPSMEAVARALGMSARSLRRHLKTEGFSFQDLVEETLGVLAKQLLDDWTRSIQDVAYTMGFSEPSAFHRAFKRWTGLTPREYRDGRSVSASDG